MSPVKKALKNPMQTKKILNILAVALTASVLNPAVARPVNERGKRLEPVSVGAAERQKQNAEGANNFAVAFSRP